MRLLPSLQCPQIQQWQVEHVAVYNVDERLHARVWHFNNAYVWLNGTEWVVLSGNAGFGNRIK